MLPNLTNLPKSCENRRHEKDFMLVVTCLLLCLTELQGGWLSPLPLATLVKCPQSGRSSSIKVINRLYTGVSGGDEDGGVEKLSLRGSFSRRNQLPTASKSFPIAKLSRGLLSRNDIFIFYGLSHYIHLTFFWWIQREIKNKYNRDNNYKEKGNAIYVFRGVGIVIPYSYGYKHFCQSTKFFNLGLKLFIFRNFAIAPGRRKKINRQNKSIFLLGDAQKAIKQRPQCIVIKLKVGILNVSSNLKIKFPKVPNTNMGRGKAQNRYYLAINTNKIVK